MATRRDSGDVPAPAEAEAMPEESADGITATADLDDAAFSSSVQRFRLRVVEGSEIDQVHESQMDLVQIGNHALNDLRLSDSTVSRFHCEVFVAHRDPGRTAMHRKSTARHAVITRSATP